MSFTSWIQKDDLDLTKVIVERHEGKIIVDSDLGKGALFSIEFPRVL